MTIDEILITFLNHLSEQPSVTIPTDDVSVEVSQAMGATFDDLGMEPGQEVKAA